MKVGLWQGCVVSPWLSNLFMDGVVRGKFYHLGERGKYTVCMG